MVIVKNNIIELDENIYQEKRGLVYKLILEAIEKPIIEKALDFTGGNQLKAAKLLGINRNTIRTKIKKLGIELNKWKA